jgi:hypothetical protein
MAKGQKRSGREAKKPKKTGAAKPKVASALSTPPAGMMSKHHARKP